MRLTQENPQTAAYVRKRFAAIAVLAAGLSFLPACGPSTRGTTAQSVPAQQQWGYTEMKRSPGDKMQFPGSAESVDSESQNSEMKQER
ncbi:MAG: hypothetical protein V1861_03055 [Candidatus Micrarchaeota archaeon]